MKYAGVLSLLLLFTAASYGETKIAVSGSLEWERMEINAALALDLGAAGVRLPAGRAIAEEILAQESPGLLRPHILTIPVDSSNTVEDLLRQGEFSLRGPGNIALSARKTPPALSPDMSRLFAAYTIDLNAICSQIIRHSRAQDPWRPLRPIPAAARTGIIIIAEGELPVHGKHEEALVRPCLFPKVWDSDMNLIYERNMLDPANGARTAMVRYVSQGSIFRPGPTGLSPELTELVGANPLRILARGVFGVLPTDPIIDREDALLILSSEENRRLLREGRVAIVLQEKVLKDSF